MVCRMQVLHQPHLDRIRWMVTGHQMQVKPNVLLVQIRHLKLVNQNALLVQSQYLAVMLQSLAIHLWYNMIFIAKFEFEKFLFKFHTKQTLCTKTRALSSTIEAACIWPASKVSGWPLAVLRLTSFRVIINIGIVSVQTWSCVAVKLVPPHANKMLLTENCSVRTKEIESCVQCTNMEHLTLGLNVCIVARELLLFAIK